MLTLKPSPPLPVVTLKPKSFLWWLRGYNVLLDGQPSQWSLALNTSKDWVLFHNDDDVATIGPQSVQASIRTIVTMHIHGVISARPQMPDDPA